MGRHVLLRLRDAVPTVFLVLTLVFVVLRLLPGDPALTVLGENATAEQITEFRARMGFDAPLPVQFGRFLLDVARLRFGTSFITRTPIVDMLAQNLPYTIELTVWATAIGVALGVPVGVASAVRQGGRTDHASRLFALFGFAVPDFYLAALLLIYLSLNLGLFPINGGGEGFVDRVYHVILPAFTLGVIKAAFVSRLTRSALLEVLGRDFVRTARAKGAREGRVVYRHALRNALLPIVTGLGLSILSTLSGSVAVELIFGRPGLGSMLINGIETRDYPVVQAGIVVFALFVVAVNVAVDMLNTVIDPRIRAA
jgi:ABC-type dipeptide/oligopeptide/nickel transport system permease component